MGRAGAHALQHPVGLCWLAASLRGAGFSPGVVDFEVEPFAENVFEELLKQEQPAATGFTAMTPGIDGAARMAGIVKRVLPGAATIIGGAHAAMFPARTLEEYPQFDCASTGDGEGRIVEICRAASGGTLPQAKIPGCAIRRDGEIIDYTGEPGAQADLDSLPIPARDLLNKEHYRGASTPGFPADVYKSTEIFTSRGCPGKCVFCCSDKIFGRKVRYRPIPKVIEEIEECIGVHGFNHFTIDDDTFTLRRERVIEFCAAMAPLPATWDCDTRVDHVDEELVKTMAEAGCKKIAFGVETGSPKILKLIKKGITLEQVRAAFGYAKKAGVMSCGFFMVGNHPEETAEDIARTWKLIKEISPDLISVLVATPYPGTELYDLMRAENLLGDAPWSAYSQSFTAEAFSRTKTLTAEDLKRAQSGLLRKFYLRPGYILRRLASLRSPGELKYWVSSGLSFVRYLGGAQREEF